MHLLPVWQTFQESATLTRTYWKELFRFTGPLALLLGAIQVILPLVNSPLFAAIVLLFSIAPILWLHVQLFAQIIRIVHPAYEQKPGLKDPWAAAGRLIWSGFLASLAVFGLFLLIILPTIALAAMVFGGSLSSLSESLGTAGGLAGAGIASIIIVLIGAIVALVVTARVYLHWYFFSQETLLEGTRGVAALKASTAIVRGYAWKLFAWVFLAGIICLIASLPGQIIAEIFSALKLPLAGVVVAIVYATLFVTPLATFATTKLYVHMKEKRHHTPSSS